MMWPDCSPPSERSRLSISSITYLAPTAQRTSSIPSGRSAVGHKPVLEEMLKRDLSLGGEQSGHIIFSDYLFTGDGLCTALNVLRTLALTGRSLADLAADLTAYP